MIRKAENTTRDILWDGRKGYWFEARVRNNAGRYHGWDSEEEIFVEGSESAFSRGKGRRAEVEVVWFLGRRCLEFLPPQKLYGSKRQRCVDFVGRIDGWFAAVRIPFSR